MKKVILLLTASLLISACSNPASSSESSATSQSSSTSEPAPVWNYFEHWNNCQSLTTLKTFVEKSKVEDTADYIKPEDRIAVFDMDGTVFGELFPTYLEYTMFVYRALEDPDYAPIATADVVAVAEEIQEGAPTHTYASDMAIRHGQAAARAYAGMTLKEFADYTVTFLQKPVPGFTGMNYARAIYQPMIDVVDYLHDSKYEVYIVSGSDRFLCREIVRDTLNIPDNHVIGMDVTLIASNQGNTDGVDYQYTALDQIVRGDELLIKNLKFNKVRAIAKEIGKQPVLSFGNTSGDQSMHMYTITNNPNPSAAFMVVADDGERDYGGAKNDYLHEKWQGMGFHTFSMKNDWNTIYGDNVRKA